MQTWAIGVGVVATVAAYVVAQPAASALTLDEAEALVTSLAAERAAALRAELGTSLDDGVISADGVEMRLLERTFGDAPETGCSLWISLHGGGNAAPEVNDQQWRNQIRLYEPTEGVYIAPRAPTNTWNLWHESHIDTLFDQLIDACVAVRGVDPNRVYLMGYSAGGDGVYQLAPRMGDRFAAASMMAGHPNDADPRSLRNLPFALFIGGDDNAYNRADVARQWGEKLDALHAADPDGYEHRVTHYEGLGHWMERRDAEALPWMASHTRNPWPTRVVWQQDNVTRTRFAWLAVSPEDATPGSLITATVDGQTITIEADGVHQLTLRLRDALIDLDLPVVVVANGSKVFEGVVPRTRDAIDHTLSERLDAPAVATAELTVSW